MLRILYTSPFDLELTGPRSDLEELRNAVLSLGHSSEHWVETTADTSGSPAPYDRLLDSVVVTVEDGPARVWVELDRVLNVSGSEANLAGFASFLRFAPDAKPGAHSHYEFVADQPYVSRDSIPLVIGLESGTRTESGAYAAQTVRDFHARPSEEMAFFLANTWRNSCNQADLGMTSPREYEIGDTIFVEGLCEKCGARVRSIVSERRVDD